MQSDGTAASKCVTCGEPAVVGFGDPSSVNWLCQEHFEKRIKMAGDVIRTAMEVPVLLGGDVTDSASPGAFGPAPDGLPLTGDEVAALPDGTPVIVIWSGGNGPHEYVITVDVCERRYACAPRDIDNDRMRYYNPFTFVGQERYHTRVWKAEA